MKKVNKIILMLLGVVILNSCTKETYVGDELIPTKNNSKDKAKIAIGRDNNTGEIITAMLSYKNCKAGENGIDIPHVYLKAISLDNTRSVSLFVADNDQNASIIGDIITVGLEEGECAWCECVSDHWNEMQDGDPTGGMLSSTVGSVFMGPAAFAIGVGCGFAVVESLF